MKKEYSLEKKTFSSFRKAADIMLVVAGSLVHLFQSYEIWSLFEKKLYVYTVSFSVLSDLFGRNSSFVSLNMEKFCWCFKQELLDNYLLIIHIRCEVYTYQDYHWYQFAAKMYHNWIFNVFPVMVTSNWAYMRLFLDQQVQP